MEMQCSDLGVQDCFYVARGETPEDVVRQMAAHLRAEHDINLPDAGAILEGGRDVSTAPGDAPDEGIALLVNRIRDALGVGPATRTDVSDGRFAPKSKA